MSFKNFDFVGKSRIFYVLSIVITILGLVFLLTRGLNYGVDFQSGSNVDISLSKPLTTEQINTVLEDAGIGEDASVTPGNDRVNIRFSEVLTEDQDQKLRSGIEKLDEKATFEINTVDPEMAKELGRNAIYAVLISCIGIIIYVSIRFEWRFAIAAIVALLHDAFVVISIFSILGLEVDLTFIIAVLTIIGYSINDTIVIFDRIRENLRFAKIKRVSDLKDLVNKSLSQTIGRSIYTALSVFIAAFFMLLLGGESIQMFSLAICIGLAFGAYSSIFIASPLWLLLKGRNVSNKPNSPKPSKDKIEI
ncbi:protein translocase subunit SecF [Paenibacillus sp. FSL H8-0457]|uniref:protein translocase subunit SecF n=1 Tax=Bacillales TaxID=1385 RepID=UPI00017899B4|nr:MULTISPECIES: protein translocase subunit SecF [Paenibacillus]ETT56930.1 protein-export membrane protein secF [Paenibacillus sp. FSL H8-457]MCM3256178.1 protein translocase subunit SecF [Paenibacillus lautus]PCL94133.1 protein translocase subunit SecF [Paenibacillus lautus]QOT07982.1 protein translocase subunit SecF [Paenibacillus sp. JNUCC-32]WFB60235.1 protein translocase subunit SecF [Paenibacillus sp. BR1-192]